MVETVEIPRTVALSIQDHLNAAQSMLEEEDADPEVINSIIQDTEVLRWAMEKEDQESKWGSIDVDMTPKPRDKAGKSLEFAPEYKHKILYGRKTATVRYDDEKGIEEGDLLKFKTPSGEPFARAEATNVEIAEVRKAPDLIRRMDERHGADNWKELRESLNHFYDDDIWASTVVKVIVFRAEGSGQK